MVKMNLKNLTFMNKTEEWLKSELEHKGFDDFKSIFYAYVKEENDSLTIFRINNFSHF